MNGRRIMLISVVAMGLGLGGIADAARHRKPAQSSPSVDAGAASHGAVTIRGVVRKGASPVAGTRVWLAHKHVSPAKTDDSGRFEFRNLRPGTYKLYAGPRPRGTNHAKTHVNAGETADVVVVVRPPRPRYSHGGVARPH